MLNCLLHSRVQTGIESNTDFYDEDVNVYLAHLLNSYIDPKHLDRIESQLVALDPDLFRMIVDGADDRQRFELYRANADHLLISVAIFDVFDDHRQNRHPAFHVSKETYIARASSYYALASSYAAKLGRGSTGLSETLRKLSVGIENYVKILSYMRGHYLNLIRRYSAGELFHLERSIKEIERQQALEELRNEFLDTYNAWLKKGSPELKEKLAEQVRLLRELDPTFHFELPR